jgi:hypothetical protein
MKGSRPPSKWQGTVDGSLPLPAALYGVLVWPFLWGLTEQMTYHGYLVPRRWLESSLPHNLSAIQKCVARAVACSVGRQSGPKDFSDFARFGRVRQAPSQAFTLLKLRRSAR